MSRLLLLALGLSLVAASCGRRERAAIDTMLSDLRLLSEVQEDSAAGGGYAQLSGTATSEAPLQGYAPSPGVTVSVSRTATGWTATATHYEAPGHTCVMIVGADSAETGPEKGEPRCN